MTHKPTRSHLVLPLAFLGLATPFFLAALGVIFSRIRFVSTSTCVEGRIVQILAATGDLRLGRRELTAIAPSTTEYGEYYPVIEYDWNGNTERFRQRQKTDFPPAIGTTIPLRVSLVDRSDVRIAHFMDLWFLPALLLSMSTPLVLIGALLLRSSLRNKQRMSELARNGRRIECRDLSLGPDPYTMKDGKNPMRITARFQIDGQEYLAHGPSLWEHPPVPDSITILYHPDDPGICEIAEAEKSLSSK